MRRVGRLRGHRGGRHGARHRLAAVAALARASLRLVAGASTRARSAPASVRRGAISAGRRRRTGFDPADLEEAGGDQLAHDVRADRGEQAAGGLRVVAQRLEGVGAWCSRPGRRGARGCGRRRRCGCRPPPPPARRRRAGSRPVSTTRRASDRSAISQP